MQTFTTTDTETTMNKVSSDKETHVKASGRVTSTLLRFSAWYAFWLTTLLILYRSIMPVLPYRDHPILMLGRHLAQSDWQWLVSMFSYNRTRILLPGDYFAFRPIHMSIVAMQDIFFRYNLTAQGVVNCMMFAFAATMFCSVAKRFIGVYAALAMTFLWIAVPAGSALIMWQHIAPYILCPAFFLGALRCIDGDDLGLGEHTRAVLAAIFVGAACLTHESAVLTALSVAAVAIVFGNRGFLSRQKLLFIFLLPATIALLMNVTDYFVIHPPPSLTGPADRLSSQTTFMQIFAFIGAIGSALVASPLLHLDQMTDGFPEWNFINESPLLLNTMALPVLVLLFLVVITSLRELRNNGITRRILLFSIFSAFFIATFAACTFRMYSRDVFYMAQATYYYSLFAVILSILGVGLLSTAKEQTMRRVITTVIWIIGGLNIIYLQKYLRYTDVTRKPIYTTINEGRKLVSNDPSLCFNGSIPFSTLYSPLFNDISCANRPGATPLYLTSNPDNSWLSSIILTEKNSDMIPLQISLNSQNTGANSISTIIPYGHTIQFTARNIGIISLILATPEIQQGFFIERNLLSRRSSTGFNSTLYNVFDYDPAHVTVVYKLTFTPENILLFANNRLVGELPLFQTTTTTMTFALQSPDNVSTGIQDMLISKQPSSGTLQFIPRHNLAKRLH